MSNESTASWKRAWSTEEIIANAENWSLAGDVALLTSIKAYADNLLSKSVAVSDNVDDLLSNLDEVSLKLDLSRNELQSLRNTQFIESRVYEDDETLEFKDEPKVEKKEPTEDEKEQLIKQAILEGLQVVDKYFDKIEVSISDSEDESDRSYVLQVKDLYANRPLPLLIGSEEWYKTWHVGLADSSSENESDKASEVYSESDSEDDLPKDLLKGSESSSELDFSSQASENRPVANSTFNDSLKKPDIFASDEDSEPGSLPVKTPLSSQSFAEQLAAKLGSVVTEREASPVVNRQPIQPAKAGMFPGDLFADEPPPLDELEDTVLPKSAQSGLFSGGQGLFDDNEDVFEWERPSVKPENKLVVDVTSASLLPKASQVSKGLFDSDSGSSDEDIFVANKKQLAKQPFKSTLPLFEDEPPELGVHKKAVDAKNPEAASTFKTSEVLIEKDNVLKSSPNLQQKQVSLFDDDEVDDNVAPIKIREATTKKVSLFDDDDELFEDNLFAGISKKTTSLFDDDEDLFTSNVNNNRPPTLDTKEAINVGAAKNTLFSNLDGLFGQASIDVSNNNSINSIVEGDLEVVTNEQGGENVLRQVIGAEITPAFASEPKKSTKGLFDDEDDDVDELFKDIVVGGARLFENEPPADKDASNVSLVLQRSVEVERVPSVHLFGSSPPPDDDDWDVKSDHFSDNDDQFSFHVDASSRALSLFDDEPPSLGPNDSSGIVRDQRCENATRLDVDESFNPYASSSRRLSSDMFSEQQSQDSFFVTKNKTDSMSVPPVLDIIPEVTASNVDVTPSGNFEDFESSEEKSWPTSSEVTEKPISLFDDDYEAPSDTDDLFTAANVDAPKLSEKRLTLFDSVVSSNAQLQDKLSNTEDEAPKVTSDAQAGSPGKLKHNLKINVNALLPGYAPPKLKDLKSHSLDLPKEQEEAPTTVSTPDETDRLGGFEDLAKVEVLHSVTKDRARIPIKRRPSTRRGRQQAIRSAAVATVNADEDKGVAEIGAEKMDEAPLEQASDKPKATELFADDPINIPLLKADMSIFDSGDSDTDLFGAHEKKKAETSKVPSEKKSLFNDSSSDDDLFTGAKKRHVSRPVEKKVKKTSALRKLENIQADDDPLSSLLK